MRSPVSRKLFLGGAMLALTSLFILLAPRAEAANGPFNGKIAFASNRDGNFEIYVMNPDGTGQARLTNNSTLDIVPAWSPDGKKIVFESFRDGNEEIYVMNADGSGQTRLTNNPASDFNPAWSPDGQKIAFTSIRDGGNNFEIYVMNADGSGQTRLTNNPAFDTDASWSPDGKKIAFDSDRDGNFEIYVMNPDGTGQARLTNNTVSDDNPDFSPDGKTIAFSRSSGAIFVMNVDGTNQIALSASPDFRPNFSPDGTKITFQSQRDGNDEVYVMDANGANQTRLTNNPTLDKTTSWQPVFSPESIGVFRPSTGQWLLRNTPTAGVPDITLSFGQAGDLPVTGDWNGDGRTDIGVFRNGTFFLGILKTTLVHSCLTCPFTFTTTIDPQPSFNFGQAGDLPIAGDWNGDGVDDVGLFRNGQFLLRQPITTKLCSLCPPITLITTITINFGQAGDQPIAGDWNGDGKDSVGVYRNGFVFMTNTTTSSNAAPVDLQFLFGNPGFLPLAGDWNSDGIDTIGVTDNQGLFTPNATTFALRNSNSTGVADISFAFGNVGDLPVAGDWNGANNPPNSGVNDPADGSSHVNQTQTFTTTCSDPDGWHNISTIDFKIAKSEGNGNGIPLALWVQFDEGSNVIRFYNPDSQTWAEGKPGSNVVLSSRFAEINLAQTSVHSSGPTAPSVQITWSIVFKDAALMNNYKQYLKITDDAGLTTGFDKVGSWSVVR